MGKGKGSFDHWATRVAVNQILFELRGALHEEIIRDAFRLAGHKLPGEALRFCVLILRGANSLQVNTRLLRKGIPPWSASQSWTE
jgi:ribosomal protein L16/L10AE